MQIHTLQVHSALTDERLAEVGVKKHVELFAFLGRSLVLLLLSVTPAFTWQIDIQVYVILLLAQNFILGQAHATGDGFHDIFDP